MIRQTYHFEIISPCFCAGADQGKAEIRAASIRGQLRWWFRVLGGSSKDEAAIFGKVAGGDHCTSSSLTVRIADFERGPIWNLPAINQNTPENYVWHFASVSGTTQRGKTGPRWQSQGAIPPGSKFTLHLTWHRSIPPALKTAFDQALQAFLALGTIGLRGTRGLGAFLCEEARNLNDQKTSLEDKGFIIRQRIEHPPFTNLEDVLRDYSSWLRYDFRKKWKHDISSPLGTSSPRQTSAIRFRPIRLSSGQFTWLAYEAPHKRILAQASRTSPPILEKYSLSGAAPTAPDKPRRH